MSRLSNWKYDAGMAKDIEASFDESYHDIGEHTEYDSRALDSKVKATADTNYIRLLGRRAVEAATDNTTRQAVENVYNSVPWDIHLTGRTPEQISQETGIEEDELFPKDAKILYIGDPWQKMGLTKDNPNLTLIISSVK